MLTSPIGFIRVASFRVEFSRGPTNSRVARRSVLNPFIHSSAVTFVTCHSVYFQTLLYKKRHFRLQVLLYSYTVFGRLYPMRRNLRGLWQIYGGIRFA